MKDFQAVKLDGKDEALKLRNQLNELKVERQKHVILILGLVLLVITLIGTFAFYIFQRKRMSERNRLIQENVMLKQQEELSALREKEALLREKMGIEDGITLDEFLNRI